MQANKKYRTKNIMKKWLFTEATMVLLITRLLIFLSYQASSICFTLTGIIVFACEGFDIDDWCDEGCVEKFLFRLITEDPGSLAYPNRNKNQINLQNIEHMLKKI
jgi:hypothetical protein